MKRQMERVLEHQWLNCSHFALIDHPSPQNLTILRLIYQQAYQARKEQARVSLLRARWQRFTILTQDFLIGLSRPGEEAMACRIADVIDRELEAERIRQTQQTQSECAAPDLMAMGERLGYCDLKRVSHSDTPCRN